MLVQPQLDFWPSASADVDPAPSRIRILKRTHRFDSFPRIPCMAIDDLVFVGLNGYAVALHRDTGDIVWTNNQMKRGYVTFLLDGDRLIVSTNGYIYCLDPLTGDILWHNPMTGYGMGAPTSLISVRGQSDQAVIHQVAAAIAAQRAATTNSTST